MLALLPLVVRADIKDLTEIVAVKEVTATSTLVDGKDKLRDRYAPWRVLSPIITKGRWQTAWCEGKSDEGVGESLKITFAQPEKLGHIGETTQDSRAWRAADGAGARRCRQVAATCPRHPGASSRFP